MIGFDYLFLTGENLYTREEWMADDNIERSSDPSLMVKILVVRDMKSKSIFGHVVRSKGSDEDFAVDCLVSDIKWLGYSKVILKSDNEPAIVKLLTETLKSLRVEGLEQVCEEHPPPYDPQSNGGIEIGVKLIKGQLRTMRSDLESRVGFRILVAHPIITWLVGHAANVMTLLVKGKDCRTAYQRVRGRPCS